MMASYILEERNIGLVMRICSIADCDRQHYGRSWCEKHYKRWQAHGDPTKSLQADCKHKLCSVEGCEMPARKVFLCNTHYTKNWMEKNTEKHRLNKIRCTYRRDMRRRGFKVRHTHEQWQELLNRFEGICAYCESEKATTKDHVVPLSRGGSDEIDNILPACRSCNCRKHTRSLEEWLVIRDYRGTYQFDHVPINEGRIIYHGKVYGGE